MSTTGSSMSGSVPAPPPIDISVVRELIGGMSMNYGMLNQTMQSLQGLGGRVRDLGPNMQAIDESIDGLHKSVLEQDQERVARVDNIKALIKGDLKQQGLEEMKRRIEERIKIEVAKQVHEQMDKQIVPEHFPKTLKEHVKDGDVQIVAMKAAIANSKARRENANVSWMELNKALAEIVRPDGTKSAAWPANITSLFAYDDAKVRQLVADYALHDHGLRVSNINSFLGFIGVVGIRQF